MRSDRYRTMAKPKEVSHAEVWDDTALVDSWNEALAEYKKYHSLAAKGMKIERVLDDAEKREKEDSTAFQVDADPDGNSEPAVTTASNNKQSAYDEEGVSPTPAALPTHVDTQALPGAAAVPQVLMNNGKRFHTSLTAKC